MKQQIRAALMLLVFATAGLAGTAHAQSAWGLTAHIPFEFHVGDKTFPAGDYSVRPLLQNHLLLRNDRGQTVASVFTNKVWSLSAPAKPVLRFTRTSGQLTLAEVWREDSPYGQQLPVPKTRALAAQQHTLASAAVVAGGEN